MAVTLAQIQLNAQDDVQAGVIDQLRRSSALLDATVFDDAVHPGGGGGTLTYGYNRVSTYATAATRAFGAEFNAQEAQKARFTVDLQPFGGAFEVDRVFNRVGGLVDEVAFQTQQKIAATIAEWNRLFILGDSGSVATEFDGLDVALAGTTTEFNATASVDWTSATIVSEATAHTAMELLDEMLDAMHMSATFLLGNTKIITRLRAIARRAGYLTEVEDAFGRRSESYNGIRFVDLGERPADASPIVPIETRNPDGGGNVTGLTDLYAVALGLEGVHGVSLAGNGGDGLVNAYLDEFAPTFRQSGATRRGELEMVAALAIRHTKSAAVLRNIKVQ